MSPVRRVCLSIAIAVLPLIAAAVAPAKVHATCGDYVHIGDRAQTVDRESHPVPADPARPCQGPLCSQHHPPMAPATPAAPNHADEHGLRILVVALPLLDSTARFEPIAAAFTSSRPADIFHPPKSGSRHQPTLVTVETH